MYYSFTGKVTLKGPDFVCLTVEAIEWQFIASLNTLSALKLGDQAKIYSYLHHNDSSLALYGFADLAEKELFLNLIRVSGIGPRAAIKMLGGSSPDELLRALEQGDITQLSRLPGIGKSTAQKVVLALQGKLVLSSEDDSSDELVNSLVGMGYDKKATTKIVADLRKEMGPTVSEGALVKAAIVKLSS